MEILKKEYWIEKKGKESLLNKNEVLEIELKNTKDKLNLIEEQVMIN